MVEYALADVTSLPDPMSSPSALAGVPPWRQATILRYRQAQDRKRSLGAWRLMERMLSARGLSAQDVTVDARGKPQCPGAHVSLSHAGDLALCAVSGAPVGCDVERAQSAPFEIAPHVFVPRERAYLRAAQGAEEAERRFFALWTLKESYMKMTGEGLALEPQRLEIRLPALELLLDGEKQTCTLFHVSHGEYEISLCAAAPGERFTLRQAEAL